MIVSSVINSLGEKVREIINALANRLTAADNWGPEGQKGQVLTSNGPGPDDPPPSFQNIGDILTGISPEVLQGIPGLQGPPGPAGAAGPPGSEGQAGFVPTYIAPDETFVVPAGKQALFEMAIDSEGMLEVDGYLILVN